jgi:uncharacterized RDD family membrane protein YckC
MADPLLPPARFVQRAAAFLIDFIIVAILALVAFYGSLFLLFFPFMILANLSRAAGGFVVEFPASYSITVWLVTCLVVVAYYTLQLSRTGQTVGKRVMRIQVISKAGNTPTLSQALGRTLAYSLSMLPLFIGFLLPLWDENHQALHDKVVGTYVVNRSV